MYYFTPLRASPDMLSRMNRQHVSLRRHPLESGRISKQTSQVHLVFTSLYWVFLGNICIYSHAIGLAILVVDCHDFG